MPAQDPGTAGRLDGPAAFLSVEHVEKTYVRKSRGGDTRLHVLEDITWSARRGEFVTIIGPSGCGKSTILNCIAGLTSYDSGSIVLDGAEIHEPGLDRAVVFQAASLLPWRSVESNVAYGLQLRRELGGAEIKERVRETIHLVGLDGFEKHYPHEISGGMQQRTNLARALAVQAKLLLMDEPFGALDALTKETMQDELSALIGTIDRTTVFITHDIIEAVFLADRVLVMSSRPGKIIEMLEVSFPRPRPREITELPEFDQIVHRLRELLRPRPDAA